jgi:hypothetical protein
MPFSILRRSAARVSKPVDGFVDGSGNQVLNLCAKALALKRASFSSGLKELYLWFKSVQYLTVCWREWMWFDGFHD